MTFRPTDDTVSIATGGPATLEFSAPARSVDDAPTHYIPQGYGLPVKMNRAQRRANRAAKR